MGWVVVDGGYLLCFFFGWVLGQNCFYIKDLFQEVFKSTVQFFYLWRLVVGRDVIVSGYMEIELKLKIRFLVLGSFQVSIVVIFFVLRMKDVFLFQFLLLSYKYWVMLACVVFQIWSRDFFLRGYLFLEIVWKIRYVFYFIFIFGRVFIIFLDFQTGF